MRLVMKGVRKATRKERAFSFDEALPLLASFCTGRRSPGRIAPGILQLNATVRSHQAEVDFYVTTFHNRHFSSFR